MAMYVLYGLEGNDSEFWWRSRNQWFRGVSEANASLWHNCQGHFRAGTHTNLKRETVLELNMPSTDSI